MSSSEELIGQTLGQYEIRTVLGKGGMSTVYLAYQPSMDRTVAIKVLPREFLHDDMFLQRFQTEARVISRLEHPYILPVYDVGEDRGIPYIVMRYLSGGSVSDLIVDRLPDNRTVVRIVSEIADALDYAHQHGVIHRDLKPSNILLDSSGHAYLADFGIARVAQEASGLTGSRVIGTPTYIAPEQVQKGQPITHSVDIYALGIVTFEMLAGSPPYYDEDPTKTMMAHVMEPVPSLRALDPNISPEVERVIQKVLAKTPRERYQSAGEFAHALADALGVAAPTPTGPRASGGPRTAPPPPVIPPPPGSSAEPYPDQAERAYKDPYYEPPPKRRRRREGFPVPLWLIVPFVFVALFGGVILTAYAITDGNPGRLFVILTPGSSSRTPQPTVTVTPGGDVEVTEAPDVTPRPQVLPAPGGGDRLAFASNRAGHYDIYLIDIDGSNLRRLTDQPGPDFDPAWSPDGTQIAYSSRENLDQNAQIWIMSADGSDKRQLTSDDSDNTDPDWSPDGEWIVFSSNRDGDFEIYVMRPDGSEIRQITSNTVQDLSPRWAPNGVLTAYYSRPGNQSTASELFIMDSFGGVPNQLTSNTVIDQWPDWSSDNLRIAFTSGEGVAEGQRAIFVLDFSTGIMTQLTEGPGRDDDPAWSADSTRIAFDSDRDGDGVFDLFVIRLSDGDITQLTDNAGDNVAPAWQPQP